MGLHIGANVTIPLKDIVAIFDLEVVSCSERTKEFLRRREKRKTLINVTKDVPKAYVLIKSEVEETIYLTSLSTATLKKRIEQLRVKTI